MFATNLMLFCIWVIERPMHLLMCYVTGTKHWTVINLCEQCLLIMLRAFDHVDLFPFSKNARKI